MKNAENTCAGILGGSFLVFGFNFFFQFFSMPAPPADSLVIPFFQATGQSGFMAFVKISEIVSALLIIIPKFRNWGLIILGPIIVNIIAFNVFIAGGAAIFQPPVIVSSILFLVVLWFRRNDFLELTHNKEGRDK
ncbi:MAG: hypothetical protein HN754_09195 [Opitutae bacterium]|jgi:putative oxidoreductase|nr:hypothetical protein [Opitutae bacterium]